ITVSGNLTRFEGTLSACGAGGGSGGPICANNGGVTLEAAQIGAPGASGRMHVDTGIGTAFNQAAHGTASERSTVGGIFIQRRHLPLDTSTHLLDVAPGAPIELAANSRIAVDASINAPGSSILLEAGPDQPVR